MEGGEKNFLVGLSLLYVKKQSSYKQKSFNALFERNRVWSPQNGFCGIFPKLLEIRKKSKRLKSRKKGQENCTWTLNRQISTKTAYSVTKLFHYSLN